MGWGRVIPLVSHTALDLTADLMIAYYQFQPSVSYSEQQPSTSSAVTASQSGVSLSGIASQATSTLRSSIAAGTESNVERAAKQVHSFAPVKSTFPDR